MKKHQGLLIFLFLLMGKINAQTYSFTYDDTLRGSITPERAWWDLVYYDLYVNVQPEKKSISGRNVISFIPLSEQKEMQIDMQFPMQIDSILFRETALPFKPRGKNAYFVTFPENLSVGERQSVTVYYHGIPREAKRAPWDGGFSWAKSGDGSWFIATSCQGLGASSWWPCKDHMYDEPEGMIISVEVPKGLMDVSNGQLIRSEEKQNTSVQTWQVKNPINNYGVNINIAPYVHFSEEYAGLKGTLHLDYYVLPENLAKAKSQFQQVKEMLTAFEYWFGPYPFYEDGFKLVEVPYLGMEHQSSVTYGNRYKNGYLGTDLSGTGWGLKWDYIIIHEAGHEWFANNITYKDIADMWIHESFTTYSECLFVEYFYGKEAGAEYVLGMKSKIANASPIVGIYDVNHEGSGDMYYKGAVMLHTLRQWVNNDELWLELLRGLNRDFYHQTVTGAEIESYMMNKTGLDLRAFFDQYLRTTDVPLLEFKFKRKHVYYRWTEVVSGFNMPVDLNIDGKTVRVYPTEEWSKCPEKVKRSLTWNKNIYMFTFTKKRGRKSS